MASPPRRPSATGVHHVMNRGVDHQPIFFGDEDRSEFLRRLAALAELYDTTTLAFCLMGNHFHLLLRAADDQLSEAMQHLLSVYTRHTNDRVGRDGPLFRGRFVSVPVESDPYLMWAARYIHRNPLAIRAVGPLRRYRWSSFPAYAGVAPAPAFLDVAPVTALFGGCREEVVAFTEARAARPDGPVTVADVQLLIACAIAVDDLVHPAPEAARNRLDRTVTVLVADRLPDAALARGLAATLGAADGPATEAARRRARARAAADPMVRRTVDWVLDQLGSPTSALRATA